jgi:DNA-binding SARP family transcriptional activator/ABC-type transport system substrate-binding protein
MGDSARGTHMEFRILGPLEVRSGGHSLPLGGPKQRAVLALLLLGANRVVSRERLIAELWPDALGRDAEHALTLQISRLRKVLSATGEGEPRVITRSPGYVLRVEHDELDLDRYERLVAEGRAALAAGNTETAVARLREAESLWRGRPLADLEFEPFARLDVDRLEEQYLTGVEERIEAELAIGRHRSLVPELERLVGEHPLRERLRADLMRALYASSRQAEALAVYTETRKLLVDELGIEPSESLRELERMILNQDTDLIVATAPAPPPRPAGHRDEDRLRSQRGLRSRRGFALAAAPVIAAGLFVTILVSDDRRQSEAVRISGPGSVVFLGAGSKSPHGQVATGPGAGRLRFGNGVLWKLEDPGELLQINPRTMRLERSTPIGFAADIALAEDGVWVSGDQNTLVRVDPTYGTVAQRIRLPERGLARPHAQGGVAVGAGSVWVAQGLSRVLRIDPDTERIEHAFHVPDASVLAFGSGALWVVSSNLGTVTKIDARRNAISAVARVGPTICCLAAGGGYVWAANESGVWKLSSEGDPLAVTELPNPAAEISYGDGALWATAAGTIMRIDARTGARKRFQVGHSLNGIAVTAGLVAVSVYVPDRPEPTANLRGAILRVGFTTAWFDITDPALAAVPGSKNWATEQQLQNITCAGLLRYRAAAAPVRWLLAAEIAKALPGVSGDGRTYTFRIRPGFRFSPPSSQRVTARTFKYSIERALSPSLGRKPPALQLASDIVGLRAYRAGNARHISGITARGDTLAITLVHRAPDLPDRIAAPRFCPVPIGTPINATGDHDIPIPSAGPYYLSANGGGEVAVIRRNPNYHGSRPRRLDAVVVREQIPFARTLARVESGKDDYVAENGPALEPDGPFARRFGRGAHGSGRYVRTPLLGTDELAFNTEGGPLKDARLRRAINYALDRSAIAIALGDLPTDRYLPVDMPGSRRRSVYPLSGPDLRRARALMGGRRTTVVLTTCGEPDCMRVGRSVAADLQRIGIHVRQRHHPGGISSRTRRFGSDMVLARVFAPYPDPVAFMRRAFGVSSGALAVKRLARLERRRRLSAAGRLELALLREQPPAAAFGTPTIPEFFSARVGCKTPSALSFGVDLGSLCLRQG